MQTLTSAPIALTSPISKTLTNTFITVSGMLLLTTFAAYAALGVAISGFALIGLFGVSIGLLFAVRAYQDSAIGLVILAAFSVISGVILGPMLTHYLALNNGPVLILMAAGLTAVATMGCAMVVVVTKKSFSQMRTFLLVSTLMLLAGYLVSIFVNVPVLMLGLTVIGVIIFLGWLLMDLGRVITGEETNYISASISIYLDVLNLFTHILRLLGMTSKD